MQQGWVSKANKAKMQRLVLSGGLDQSSAIVDLTAGSGFVAYAKNVDSRLSPAVQTRNGQKLSRTYGPGIRNLFIYKNQLYAVYNTGLYRIGGGRIDTGEIGFNDPVAVATHAAANFARYQFITVKDKLIFSRDNSPITNGLFQYDGSAVTQISTAPIVPKYVELHANRVFIAGTNQPTTYSILYYSNLSEPTGWTSTDPYVGGGAISVDTPDDTRISGLISYGGQLLVFKDQSTHVLYGEDSTNFDLSKLFDVGCVSDRSIVKTGNALYWLAADGFYRYQIGGVPQKISGPVEDYLGPPDRGWDSDSVASYDGRFIYVSPSNLGDLKPYTAVFDTEGGQWWMYDWKLSAYFQAGPTIVAGTLDGLIFTVGGTSDSGMQIPYEIISAPIGGGDETVTRVINRLQIVVDVDPGSSMSVSYSVGAESTNWVQVHQSTNQSGVPESIQIPVIVQTPGTWFRLRFVGAGRMRIHRINQEITRRGR